MENSKKFIILKDGVSLIPKSILDEVSSFNETNLPESEHYHTGKIDVWTYGEENFSLDEVTGFHRMNVLKYVSRYGKKGGYNRTDLEKAKAYIEKLIELHDRYRVGDE